MLRGTAFTSGARCGGEAHDPEVPPVAAQHQPRTDPQDSAARLPSRFKGDGVFTSEDRKPIDPDNFTHRAWARVRGSKLPRIRFHDLRHTYASLLIAQGAHPKYIQAQLGHASIQTTLDRYGHLMPEPLARRPCAGAFDRETAAAQNGGGQRAIALPPLVGAPLDPAAPGPPPGVTGVAGRAGRPPPPRRWR